MAGQPVVLMYHNVFWVGLRPACYLSRKRTRTALGQSKTMCQAVLSSHSGMSALLELICEKSKNLSGKYELLESRSQVLHFDFHQIYMAHPQGLTVNDYSQ